MLMDDLVGFAQPETCSEIIVVGIILPHNSFCLE
jgi:hypothetical protein